MDVKIIAYMQLAPDLPIADPKIGRMSEVELMATAGMHLCRTNESFVQTINKSNLKEVKDRLKWAWNSQPQPHTTVFGLTEWMFELRDVSRSLTHQLVRHRTSWYLQQSMRSVNPTEKPTIVPESVKDNGWGMAFEEHAKDLRTLYNLMIDDGVPKEDARFILPIATTSNILMKIDGCNLIHFLNLRTHVSAQWEIRELAEKMYELVKEKAPNMFSEEYKEYWY
jgi:thymidylate synthase (FAD)